MKFSIPFSFTKIINFIPRKFPLFLGKSPLSLFLDELTQVLLSQLSQTWVDSTIKRGKRKGGRNFGFPLFFFIFSYFVLSFFFLYLHYSQAPYLLCFLFFHTISCLENHFSSLPNLIFYTFLKISSDP